MQESAGKKALLKLFLKLCLSSVALLLVASQIELQETLQLISGSEWAWLLAGLLLFNASKGVSALRMQAFYSCLGIRLPWAENLKLYYVGMFYNLFLPGGIGGDGYKVYRLQKQYQPGYKKLISATLWDRISGLVLLGLLACLFYWFSAGAGELWFLDALAGAGLLLGLPLYYAGIRLLTPLFLPVVGVSSLYSLLVQLLQVLSAGCLLLALSIHNQPVAYVLLFLLSSVAAALPLTLGGVGARELVFLYGGRFLGIDVSAAVAFSLLFFAVTAFSSFFGAGLRLQFSKTAKAVGHG
jgi:glycosyltransferase 2 family protein